MDESYRLKHQQVEESHFWFLARRDMIMRLLKNSEKDSDILDLGCCGGTLLKVLGDSGFHNTNGIDLSTIAINRCKKRNLGKVFLMDAENMQFPDDEFDIIIASDILEHVENDDAAIRECFRTLKQGGKLLVFVPAFSFLWSSHDEILHHHRRYSKNQLITKLRAAGFQISKSSFWNFFLFFPTILLNLLKIRGKTDRLVQFPPFLNRLMAWLLKLENIWIEYLGFPVGLSFFAVATKNSERL